MRVSIVQGTINPQNSGSGITGIVSQGLPFTITGSGFGTKSRGLAPLIRDAQTNGLGTVDPQWLAARPALAGEISAGFIGNAMQIKPTTYNPHGWNVGAPHPNVGGIYAATAFDGNAPSDGTINWTYERFLRWQINLPPTIQSGDTCCVYARWYERNDPAWALLPTSGNNKHGGYGPYGYADTGPGESSAQSWIWNINNGQPNNNTNVGWLMELADNTSGFSVLEYPDRNGHPGPGFFGHKLNPYNPANGWLQCELEMCIDTNTGPSGHGYVTLTVNGQRSTNNSGSVGSFVTYAGRTDNFMAISPTVRSINFGCGMYGIPINDPSTTNYLADFYCDMTAGGVHGQVARIVLTEQANYAASVTVVPQVVTAWSDGSITAVGATDKFTFGQTVYVQVISESGAVQNVGSLVVSPVFDKFVSNTGNDANPGTLSQPWAITSFQNTSPNNALMAGKKIGIIGGNYSTAGLASSQPGDFSYSLMTVPGGTAANPTYVASCNSSGIYAARTAIITVPANTTTTNAILGGPGGQVVGKSSYITIDGLTINGNGLGQTNAAHIIQFYGGYNGNSTSNSAASETGILIENCELFGLTTTSHSGGNSALIFFEGIFGSVVRNNYLHNAGTTFVSDAGHVHAGEEYGCYNNTWTLNTVANCSSGFDDKNQDTGTIVSQNHFYNIGNANDAVSSGVALEGFDGYVGFGNNITVGPAPINYLIHHNVFDSCYEVKIGDQTFSQINPINIYNNTVYDTSTGGVLGWSLHATTAGTNTYYNNIYVATVGTGSGSNNAKLNTGAASANALVDFNWYFQGSGTYTSFWANFTSGFNTLASWQTAMAQDTNSGTGDPKFAVSYAAGGNPTQFQLSGASPCVNAGRIGGVSTGTATTMGAWDGTVTQIGCNFVTFPLPSS